jgi:hypothetical protein
MHTVTIGESQTYVSTTTSVSQAIFSKKTKKVKATRLRRPKSHKNAHNNAKTSFDNKLETPVNLAILGNMVNILRTAHPFSIPP